MPRWTFQPRSVFQLRTLGAEPAQKRRLRSRRQLNDVDRNDYELSQDGINVLNQSTLPRFGGSRESGGFERQSIGVFTPAGFQNVDVVLFDSGFASREIVRTPELTGSVFAAASASEVQQANQELSQTFRTTRTEDELATDVIDDPSTADFYYQGPVTQWEPPTGTGSSSGGSVGTTPTNTGGGTGGGGSYLPPPPPAPPPPPGTYDPWADFDPAFEGQ